MACANQSRKFCGHSYMVRLTLRVVTILGLAVFIRAVLWLPRSSCLFTVICTGRCTPELGAILAD
jgi:hypothetical protein